MYIGSVALEWNLYQVDSVVLWISGSQCDWFGLTELAHSSNDLVERVPAWSGKGVKRRNCLQ